MILRSPGYLEFIRSKPCLICGRKSTAHHEPLKQGGCSIKAPDTQSVPLCMECHVRHDTVGTETFWKYHDIKLEIIKLQTEYIGIIEEKLKRKK